MTTTLPTQERVDQIARSLAPDVVRIRMRDALNWADEPALYFYVIVADDVIRRLSQVTELVTRTLKDQLNLFDLDYYTYVHFRSESEQRKAQEKLWD